MRRIDVGIDNVLLFDSYLKVSPLVMGLQFARKNKIAFTERRIF